jgi:hypothetical protein
MKGFCIPDEITLRIDEAEAGMIRLSTYNAYSLAIDVAIVPEILDLNRKAHAAELLACSGLRNKVTGPLDF